MADRHNFASLRAPDTERRPVEDKHHGITRTDDYAWLRADNWQEVFRDPSTLARSDIRAHLEAENAYQTALMADTRNFRQDLFAEMKGRIKEDDSSVPMKDGPLPTARRSRRRRAAALLPHPRDGGEQGYHSRRRHRGRGNPYFRIGGVDHSPTTSGCFGVRRQGLGVLHPARARSRHRPRFCETSVPTRAVTASGRADGRLLLYALDDNHRPSKVFYIKLGTSARRTG
jgi:oligopeptidase B